MISTTERLFRATLVMILFVFAGCAYSFKIPGTEFKIGGIFPARVTVVDIVNDATGCRLFIKETGNEEVYVLQSGQGTTRLFFGEINQFLLYATAECPNGEGGVTLIPGVHQAFRGSPCGQQSYAWMIRRSGNLLQGFVTPPPETTTSMRHPNPYYNQCRRNLYYY